MSDLQVRPAAQGDESAISALILALTPVFFDDPAATVPPAVAESLSPAGCLERIESDAYRCAVAIRAGQVVGTVAVFEQRHLYHLFVAPDQQGQGTGRALWQFALQGCAPGDLTVRSSRVAVPVYERFGFERVGEMETRSGVTYQPMVLRRGAGEQVT